MILLYVYIGAAAVVAIIGLIVGAVKGFSSVRPWANEVILATVCTELILYFVQDKLPSNYLYYVLAIGGLVAFLLLFDGISHVFKAIFSGRVSGTSRFFGAITLMIKGALIITVIFAVVFMALNIVFPIGAEQTEVLEGLGGVYSQYEAFVTSGFWTYVRPYVIDMLIACLIISALHGGYHHGIFGALWKLVVLGLVVLSAYCAYMLVTKNSVLASSAAGIGESLLGVTDYSTVVGQAILGIGIGVVFLIVVIIVSVVVSRIIKKAREGMTFSYVDGILGAIIYCVIMVAVLTAVGAVLGVYSINEVAYIKDYVDVFFFDSRIGSALYQRNILFEFDFVYEWVEKISCVKYLVG